MLPGKDINTSLEFIPSLAERALSHPTGLPRKITFLTVSAKETLQSDGTTRILPGRAQVKNFRLFPTTEGDLELVEQGKLPLDLATRKVQIIDWSTQRDKPLAALTWVISQAEDGQRRKIAELTQGTIEGGVFKFLQIAATNYLLNEPALRTKNLEEEIR